MFKKCRSYEILQTIRKCSQLIILIAILICFIKAVFSPVGLDVVVLVALFLVLIALITEK